MNRYSSGDGTAAADMAFQAAFKELATGYQSEEPFEADRKDRVFAVISFALGFFFIRWVFFSAWQGWGVAVFTAAYCFTVTVYFLKKGIRITPPAIFWLGTVMVTGTSYSLYANYGLEPWRSLFLLCAAVYYVMCATGRQILQSTGNWLMLDGINGLFIIPFKNFFCQYRSLYSPGYVRKSAGRQLLSVILGVVIALFAAGMVLPLLIRADSGGFLKIAEGIYKYYLWVKSHLMDSILNGILAIPTAAYIYGLVAGCAHNRGCRTFSKEGILHMLKSMRVLASATVYTALGLICCLYMVFIGSQLPYFFSAFVGRIPEGWQIYSEYARSGFFELCQIAAINLFLLTMANLFCKKPQQESRVLKIFNCLLSMLTLLLIATAFSKMALYIGAYGLTIRRLLPCMFMILLTVVFGGIIALQKWKFSIARLSVFAGALMICGLCLLNPDGFVARYNADRYLAGTLDDFDVHILYQSGPAGIDPALKVYAQTGDAELKKELESYIRSQSQRIASLSGRSRDNLQNMLVRRKLRSLNY